MKSLSVILAVIFFATVSNALITSFAEEFAEIDKNGDNYVTAQELLSFQQGSFDEQNSAIYDNLDKNGDKTISKDEYISFYKAQAPDQKALNMLEKKFSAMDADGSNTLSKEEIASFRSQSMNDDNKELFSLLDENGDNKISREEFDNFFSMMGKVFNVN